VYLPFIIACATRCGRVYEGEHWVLYPGKPRGDSASPYAGCEPRAQKDPSVHLEADKIRAASYDGKQNIYSAHIYSYVYSQPFGIPSSLQ